MHPSISMLALRVLSLPILCASLLACAGPDDRGPSSPVADAHRPGDLIFPFESDGSMRSRDREATTRMRRPHRIDSAPAAFDASAVFPRSATNRCSVIGDAPIGGADALRFESIADECRLRIDSTARRPWMRVR